jgi:hypothetical protein
MGWGAWRGAARRLLLGEPRILSLRVTAISSGPVSGLAQSLRVTVLHCCYERARARVYA